MKGFKNTTRTQYFTGGDVGGYAKGGTAKAAKPAVAKAKAPMKKSDGGKVGKMPPLGETMKSVGRLPKELTPAQMRALEDRFGEKKRPSPADSVRSANRIAKEEAADGRRFGVFNEGGKVRKYAEGGPARKTMPPSTPMPDLNETMSNLRNQFGAMGSSGQYDMKGLQDLVNSVNTAYSQRGATADQVKDAYMRGFTNLQKTPPVDIEMPRLRQVMPPAQPPGVGDPGSAYMETLPPRTPRTPLPPPPPTYPTYYDRIQPPTPMPESLFRMAVEPLPPLTPEPYYPGNDVFQPTPPMKPPLMMEQPTPPPMQKIYEPPRPTPPMPLQNLGQVLQRIQRKQPPVDRGFIDRMPRMNVPEGAPPAGMAPVDPNKAMMMKHGGRTAMPKGKR